VYACGVVSSYLLIILDVCVLTGQLLFPMNLDEHVNLRLNTVVGFA